MTRSPAIGETVLSAEGVSVAFGARPPVLEGADLDVAAGQARGLVGESGSGKTLLALAICGLLPTGARVTAGRVRILGADVLDLPPRVRRGLLGRRIGVVFQDPVASLHPAFPVGAQVAEAVRRTGAGRREARARTVALLARMGLADPGRVARSFPHMLSGGMCQRVGIAMALAQDPEVLVADEPTTALDVTVQAEILDLLRGLREERGLAVLLVSHDLTVVAGHVARVTVLYAGRVVEEAPVPDVFRSPRHPYTAALWRAVPAPGRALAPIPGAVPAAGERGSGCGFAPRCPRAAEECRRLVPPLVRRDGRAFACFLPEDGRD